MFNTGMQSFDNGPGGPAISGKWINRQNGKIVNVRDSIIDGDNMIVITDAGNINMVDFSRTYIQASENIYDSNGNIIGTEDIDPSELLYNRKRQTNPKPSTPSSKPTKKSEVEVLTDEQDPPMEYDGILPGDAELIFGTNTATKQAHLNKSSDPKLEVIGKIFDKIDSKPRIDVKFEWAEFPHKDIKVLGKYFDITNEDIAKYLCDKYVTKEDIVAAVEAFLMNI